MCDGTDDKCCCGGAPTEPEKPAECPPKDCTPCDADKKEQDCDKEGPDKKSGGCYCG